MVNTNDYFYAPVLPAGLQQEIVQYYHTYIKPVHNMISLISKNKNANGDVVTYFDVDKLNVDAYKSIKQKLPILSGGCLISDLNPGGSTLPHTDAGFDESVRKSALNFPIEGCTVDSPTVFYTNSGSTHYDEKTKTIFANDSNLLVKVAECYMINDPVLLNTKQWHSITNLGKTKRVVLSLSIKDGMSYYEAMEYFKWME
jgi:hypothetical protein